MPRPKSVQVFRDDSIDLEARIISAIGSVGPRNTALIARMTGAHPETVRYQIKSRLARLGFRFHAEVNHRKIGLVQHWVTLNFSRPFYSSAVSLFDTLNQVGYLTYYTKLLPQGTFLTIFSLPAGKTEQLEEFLDGLVARKVLSGFSIQEALVSRHPPMDPKFFNFTSGRWEVEWEKVKALSGRPLAPVESTKEVDFDKFDLLMIKELQKNALQHTVAIARALKIQEKTLEYHHRTHVQKLKLIPSFVVRWTRDIDKKLVHSVATTRLTFRGLGQRDLAKVQTAVSKIPYLWAEDLLADGTYVATLNLPVTDIMPTFTYLNEEAGDLSSSMESGFLKPQESYLYTIPYNMFRNDEWTFNPQAMDAAVSKTLSSGIRK